MLTLKTELRLIRAMRILFPLSILVAMTWTLELSDTARKSLLTALGENSNHLLFFLGIITVFAVYLFMGSYERHLLAERHHHRESY